MSYPSKSQEKMDISDMYKVVTHSENNGLSHYKVPKDYFDYQKLVYEKNLPELLKCTHN